MSDVKTRNEPGAGFVGRQGRGQAQSGQGSEKDDGLHIERDSIMTGQETFGFGRE